MIILDLKRVRLVLTVDDGKERQIPYPYNDMVIDSIVRQTRRKAEKGTHCRRKKVPIFSLMMYIDNILVALFSPRYNGRYDEDITPAWNASRFAEWLNSSEIKNLSLLQAIEAVLEQAEVANNKVAYWPVVRTKQNGWKISRYFGRNQKPFSNTEDALFWLAKKHAEPDEVYNVARGTVLSPGVEYLPKIAK